MSERSRSDTFDVLDDEKYFAQFDDFLLDSPRGASTSIVDELEETPVKDPVPSLIRISPRLSENSEQLRKLESALEYADNMMKPLPDPSVSNPPFYDDVETIIQRGRSHSAVILTSPGIRVSDQMDKALINSMLFGNRNEQSSEPDNVQSCTIKELTEKQILENILATNSDDDEDYTEICTRSRAVNSDNTMSLPSGSLSKRDALNSPLMSPQSIMSTSTSSIPSSIDPVENILAMSYGKDRIKFMTATEDSNKGSDSSMCKPKFDKRKSLLEQILFDEDNDDTIPGIKLAPQIEQRMLVEILGKADSVLPSDNKEKVFSERRSSRSYEMKREFATIDIFSENVSVDSRGKKKLSWISSSATTDTPQGSISKLKAAKSDSTNSLPNDHSNTSSSNLYDSKSPEIVPQKKKKTHKDNSLKKFAKGAKSRIKKLAAQALLNVVASDDKELEENILSKIQSMEDVEYRKTIVREKMREASSKVARKVDARFEPNKPRVPEEINKIPLRRILHWEQMLAGIYNEDHSLIAKERIGRPVRKLSVQRLVVINDVVSHIFDNIQHGVHQSSSRIDSSQKDSMFERLGDDSVTAIQEKLRNVRASICQNQAMEADYSQILNSIIDLKASDENLEAKKSRSHSSEDSIGVPPGKIQALIDYILEDSPAVTRLNLENYPYFQSVAKEDPQRSMMEGLLAEAIALNSHLESISLSMCSIGDSFICTFAQWAQEGQLKNIKSCDFSSNIITEIGVTAIAECIAAGCLPNLEKLDLRHQLLPPSTRSVQLFSWALRANFTLVTVGLDANTFYDDQYEEAVQLVRKCLRRNQQIKNGQVSEKKVFLTSLEEKLKAIINNECSDEDEELVLKDDFMFQLLPDAIKLSLASAFKTNSTIKTLKLVGLDLGDNFFIVLAESLTSNNTIENLFLSMNDCTKIGYLAIAEALAVNRRIKNCCISTNHQEPILSGEEEVYMSELLKNNVSLLKLELPFHSEAAVKTIGGFIHRNCMEQFQKWK